MKPLEHSTLPHSHIVDVAQFFIEITDAYLNFEQNILLLLQEAPRFSPNKIFLECRTLGQQRDRLAILDQRMFAIIDLAGEEIVNNPMLHEYRIAFAKASMACSNLQQKLLSIRATLEDGTFPRVQQSFTGFLL